MRGLGVTRHWPRVIAVGGVLAVLTAGSYLAGHLLFSGAASSSHESVSEHRVLTLVNRERTTRGLPALTYDEQLAALAIAHSNDMLALGYFAHDEPGGRTYAQRVARIHRTELAENLAWGTGRFRTAASVVASWMRSPEHRHIILIAALRRVGIGIAAGEYRGTPGVSIATAEFST